MRRPILITLVLILAIAFPLTSTAQSTPAPATPPMVDTAEFGPVPAGAIGPGIPASGYLIEEIRGGLYWVTDGLYQAMFLTTGEGVVLVDAPPTIGANLTAAIASVTDEPVTYLIYSHHHTDHIGAAGQFAGATIIAQEETAALLARSNDPNRPQPTVTFADSYTLTVGTQTLQLDYHGTNHDPGNIFIYAPAQKVLMVIDIVFPGWVPFPYLAIAKDVPGFIAAHDAILSYDFDTLVAGHVTRLGTREDVELSRDYVLDVQTNAMMALQTVDFATIAASVGYENPWAYLDVYLDAVAQTCADATIPAWQDRLGGTDIFTYSHCWSMVESIRVD